MIEAVDSVKLLREIEKQASKYNRVIKVLLELHIAKEESKYGFSFEDCRAFIDSGEWRNMSHVCISGLMMMASNVSDKEQVRKEMLSASIFFDEIKKKYFSDKASFKERSWGMSQDYDVAVSCNSTMVRIGTKIFGPRLY